VPEWQVIIVTINFYLSSGSEDRQIGLRKEIEKRSKFPVSPLISPNEEDKLKKRMSLGITFRPKSLLPTTATSPASSSSLPISDVMGDSRLEMLPTNPGPEPSSGSNSFTDKGTASASAPHPSSSSGQIQSFSSSGRLSLISCDYNTSDSNSD